MHLHRLNDDYGLTYKTKSGANIRCRLLGLSNLRSSDCSFIKIKAEFGSLETKKKSKNSMSSRTLANDDETNSVSRLETQPETNGTEAFANIFKPFIEEYSKVADSRLGLSRITGTNNSNGLVDEMMQEFAKVMIRSDELA